MDAFGGPLRHPAPLGPPMQDPREYQLDMMSEVGRTMQYDLGVSTRESKLLAGEKADVQAQAKNQQAHSEARMEALSKERDDARAVVDRAQKKRDWAEHRLQQEEEETNKMRRKVAQVLADAAQERQSNEAKLEALRSHIKSQDAQVAQLRHTHLLQKDEWEESLKDAANLRRDREKELYRVQEEHHKVLETHKALQMNMRNEVHAHKEAIVGHIKDKEYLDSRLSQARDAHGAMMAKHDAMALELMNVKAANKSKVDQLTEQMINTKLDHETKMALLQEAHETTKSSLIKDHHTRTHLTVDDHSKRCSIYEDALGKAQAATQARIMEIAKVTQAADEAAAKNARRQAQLEHEVAEAKSQIGRLDQDLAQAQRSAKMASEEQARVRQMLEDALQDADTLTRGLREEMDRTRETMVDQAAEAKREIARLEDEVEGARSEIRAVTHEKAQMEGRLTARVGELSKLKDREVWEHDQTKSRLEATAGELAVTTHERDELHRVLDATRAEAARAYRALEDEHARELSVLDTEHQRRVNSLKDTIARTKEEVKNREGLLGESRNETQVQQAANTQLQADFNRAAQEWGEDRAEIMDRLDKAEKARRKEYVLKEKALTQEQEMHVALLGARGELEHSLKDTGRLRVERDEVTSLCEETHDKKEMYKKRLLDATESVDTMSKELEFALDESNLLRQERAEAIKTAELTSWEKEMVETTLQEELESIIEEKEEAEIARDQAKKVLDREVYLAKTLRKELCMSMRENDALKTEMDDIDTGVANASLRVRDLHTSQKELLDGHAPEYLASTLKPVVGRNFLGSSLRSLGSSAGWKEAPMSRTKQVSMGR